MELTHLGLVVLAATVLAAGCRGTDDPVPTERTTDQSGPQLGSGLVASTPTTLESACEELTTQTDLTVFCPPVVPRGTARA